MNILAGGGETNVNTRPVNVCHVNTTRDKHTPKTIQNEHIHTDKKKYKKLHHEIFFM